MYLYSDPSDIYLYYFVFIFDHLRTSSGGLVRVPSSGSVANTYPDATGVELWFRVRLQEDFVKLVLLNGLLIGVTLIGDTDLEEVFENLILNRTDLSTLGPEILHPDNDIEDYFD